MSLPRPSRLLAGFGLVVATGLCAGACSDPVAPPPQGAFWVRFQSSSKCPASSDEPTMVGQAESAQGKVKETIPDGTNGAAVRCKVVQAGSGFTVEASMQMGTPSINLSGPVTVKQDTQGRVTLVTAQTAGTYSPASGKACKLTGVDGAPGRIWTSFSCTDLTKPSEPNALCEANGWAVFENCEVQ
jgi:hypothetical protein